MNAPLLAPDLLPMIERDLAAVTALEARLQAFPWTLGNFQDSLNAGYSVWVCKQGVDLIGFSVVMKVIDEAHLLNIGIDPSFQGRGFGARLLRHVMETARLGGAATLFLEVRPSNERAIALYRHFGFREVGRRKQYYPAVGGREDALVFDRALG